MEMETSVSFATLALRLGTALAIGLMVGLQREFAHRQEQNARAGLFAGARTFTLISLLGATSGLAAELLQVPFVVLLTLAAVGALLTIAHYIGAQQGDIGLTTEMAGLLTFLIGLLCYLDRLVLAAALGVGLTWLLTLKPQTRLLAERISREDVYATLKFGLITVVLLPLLPDRSYGPPPFDVLVPREIWLMVVFISAISFLGYVLTQVLGARRGLGLTGLVGGLASSTALTLSMARRSHDWPKLTPTVAAAILLAWATMIVRLALILAILAPPLLKATALPLGLALLLGATYSAFLYRHRLPSPSASAPLRNPFELKPALLFGFLYAIILLLTSTAQLYLGASGLYVSSLLGGAADSDAVVLSVAQLSRTGTDLSLNIAARSIILAVVANTVVKAGLVWMLGVSSLRRPILIGLLFYSLPALLLVWMV
ncbi:MAG: MgtC/SapB family protein [Rhodothermus sp.]|nr:MgtC/SapB family protein [Rhodothermus sp.]